MRTNLLYCAIVTSAFFCAIPPAMATPAAAPAPIAGIGLGAFALVGLGYRGLKRRIGR